MEQVAKVAMLEQAAAEKQAKKDARGKTYVGWGKAA